MKRLPQLVLILSLVAACWLGMQIAHELGHVLGAWCTGGSVVTVVLRPWTISRTDLSHNPSPLVVSAAGPVLGAALPLLAWCSAATFRLSCVYLLRFFAGFCLIANGGYMACGALDRIGDAGDLQDYGLPMWTLFAFAAVTMPLGLVLWHSQGRYFGFAGAGGKVEPRAVALCVTALLTALVLEFTFGSD